MTASSLAPAEHASPAASPDVAVLGLGYVGLTLACAFARRGLRVMGYDIDPAVRGATREGRAHVHEPGVCELLRGVAGDTLQVPDALPAELPDIVVLCTGTPIDARTREPELHALFAAVDAVAERATADTLLIVRSTVVVGTSRQIRERLARRIDDPLVAFCPERTIQGRALEELGSLPQVVGATDARAHARAQDLFARMGVEVISVSSLEAAEAVKLICNSHTDVLYGFGNEVALLAEHLRLDAAELIVAANAGYPRPDIARPGFVGGSCLTKDPHLLAASVAGTGHRPRLISAARDLNAAIPERVAGQVLKAIEARGFHPQQATVLICGIAYKGRPATDDTRGAAAPDLVRALAGRVNALLGHDPLVASDVIAALGLEPTPLSEGLARASVAIFLTDHPDYANSDLRAALSCMPSPALVYDVWGGVEAWLPSDDSVHYLRLGRGHSNAAVGAAMRSR